MTLQMPALLSWGPSERLWITLRYVTHTKRETGNGYGCVMPRCLVVCDMLSYAVLCCAILHYTAISQTRVEDIAAVDAQIVCRMHEMH